MTRTSSLVIALCFLCASGLAAQRIGLPFPLKVLEESAARDSNDAAANYNVALGYWNEKRYDEADRSLRLAMALDGQFAEAHLALAFLPFARQPKLWKEDRKDKVPQEWKSALDESEREYRRAFYINPFVDLRIIGAVMPRDESTWRFDYPGFYQLFQKPYDDILAGNYPLAYQGFERLEQQWSYTARGPLPRHVYWFKALSAARIGKFDQAMVAIDRLLGEQERYEKENSEKLMRTELRTNDYRYIKAILLQAQGKKEDAIATFRAVLEHDLGMYMAHVRMAALYEGDKQWPEAIAERQHAVNANPDDPNLLIDLGITAGRAGEIEMALDALSRAGEANPRLAGAPYWTGMIQLAQGNREEAKRALTQFLAIAPSGWQGKIDLAKKLLQELPQ
jgi:tetratricopeptide (TPR) repeat protein